MGNTRKTWYVSHLIGNDSKACGSRSFPCKTLRHAVDLAGDGDSIYLDGRGTEKNPYGCEKPTTLPSKTSAFINKSLTIVGLYQRAYLSCDHGLLFHSPVSTEALNVSFENLSFVGNGVYFEGNCSVTVMKSTFSSCYSAVEMIDGTRTKLSLTKSVFTNNTNCLNLITSVEKTSDVIVDISDVMFMKNQLQDGLIMVENTRGLTSVQVRNSLFEENHSPQNTTVLLLILTDERN